jgi:hypothetical protein
MHHFERRDLTNLQEVEIEARKWAIRRDYEFLAIVPSKSFLVLIKSKTDQEIPEQIELEIKGDVFKSDKYGTIVDWMVDDGEPTIGCKLEYERLKRNLIGDISVTKYNKMNDDFENTTEIYSKVEQSIFARKKVTQEP